MLKKENVSLDNLRDLFATVSKMREDISKQDETIKDIQVLREFALENRLEDWVVRSYLEEALLWQHKYMDTKAEEFVAEMERSIGSAEDYVKKNDLKRWTSRIARYRGRLADYNKNFSEAMKFYDTAIDEAILDPDYSNNPAMVFEYKGFKILDNIRLGNIENGLQEAEKLFLDYDNSEVGSELKKRDYSTWAIWRSGLAINLCRVLLESANKDEYKKLVSGWLSRAENDLQSPAGTDIWTDFSFRKNEIAEVRGLI